MSASHPTFIKRFIGVWFPVTSCMQMDTITTLAEAELGERSFLEYDASGNVIGENYKIDPESQQISDEFKRPPY